MSKRKKGIITAITAVIIMGAGGAFLIPKIMPKKINSNKDNVPTTVVRSSYGEFDENNIGELYYSPIDPEHVAEDENGIMYSDNEILLVSNDGVSKADIEKLAEDYNAEIVGYIEQTGDYQLKLSEQYTLDELDKLAEDIQNEDIVSSAYANYICEMSEDSVDDIKVGNEWENEFLKGIDFLKGKVSLTSDDKMWGAKAINAPQAWYAMDLFKENIKPVKIGLIDTGFDTKHADLGFAPDGVFYDDGVNNNEDRNIVTDATTEETLGHGTHVAGTMAAKGNNEDGICGIYPYGDKNLYGVSFWGSSYKDGNIYLDKYAENSISSMAEKIWFSELILRNVKVINCSYGEEKGILIEYGNESEQMTELSDIKNRAKILDDFLDRLIGKGYDFVISSSAGNESNNPVDLFEKDSKRTIETKDVNSKFCSTLNYIKSENLYENVSSRIITVGAVNINFERCYYSNIGCDIYAPGGDETCKIFSTVPDMENISNANNYKGSYDYKIGTSMASPHVAGVCANVWSIDNSLSGDQVKKIVCGSVNTNSKKDYPVVDCYKAVETAYKGLKENNNLAKEPENGAILGWVVEKDNKDNKIKEATVTATVKDSDDGETYSAKTDEYGHFELILPKGDYTLTVQDKDKKYKKFTVNVKGIKNGEVLYLDYWIELEKKLTKAEKYAKIVMDNEDIWLEPLNEMDYLSGGAACWFEDIDFDSNPEFIVGGCNMGSQGGYDYNIYKIADDKLIKLQEEGYTGGPTINGVKTAPNPGFGQICASVIKDKSGNYNYIFTTTTTNIGDGYGLSVLKVNKNTITLSGIGGYIYSDYGNGETDEEYFGKDTNHITKYELIETLNDWFSGSTLCWAEIGTIPCTYKSEHLDSEWYKNATNSDSGLSDASSAYVSGCYDTLSNKDKKQALIDSYNKYKLIRPPRKPITP